MKGTVILFIYSKRKLLPQANTSTLGAVPSVITIITIIILIVKKFYIWLLTFLVKLMLFLRNSDYDTDL